MFSRTDILGIVLFSLLLIFPAYHWYTGRERLPLFRNNTQMGIYILNVLGAIICILFDPNLVAPAITFSTHNILFFHLSRMTENDGIYDWIFSSEQLSPGDISAGIYVIALIGTVIQSARNASFQFAYYVSIIAILILGSQMLFTICTVPEVYDEGQGWDDRVYYSFHLIFFSIIISLISTLFWIIFTEYP